MLENKHQFETGIFGLL